jgi:hypothetical protein
VRQGEAQGHRLGFFGAAAFQWINRKPGRSRISALADCAVSQAAVAFRYLAIGTPSSGAWVLFGAAMRARSI